MELLGFFPHLNAFLNASAGVCLLLGFYFIRQQKITRHRAAMITAAAISAVFLLSYVTYHSLRTYYFGLGPTRFTGQRLARPVYFTILTSHTVLAIIVAPFVILTLIRGLRGQFEQHKKIARLVYPVWLYVSVTGVIVYLFLYHWFPGR